MRTPLSVAVAFVLWLAPATSLAQVDQVVQSGRGLVAAARQPSPDQDDRIRHAAGLFARSLADWDRAIDAFEATAQRELATASADRAYQLHVDLGLVFRTRGRFADAIREFDAAASLPLLPATHELRPAIHEPPPAKSDLHLLRALTFEAQGQVNAADEAFRLAWSLDRENPTKAYYALRARSLTTTDDRHRALVVLAEAYRRMCSGDARPLTFPFATIDVLPDSSSPAPIVGTERTGTGFALLAKGRYSQGASALASGSNTGPGQNAPLHNFERAQTFEADGQVSEARREYTAALGGVLAGRSVIHTGIGRLALVEGDITGAVASYREAVRLNPGEPTVRLELANAYVANGSVDDAFVEIMGGLLLNPASPQLHAGLGQLRIDAGQPEEAIPALTRALELNPDRYELRYALATALTRLGRSDEAAIQLRLFERVRNELLERRRAAIQQEVEKNAGAGK
jgi:tetratricopeptide (TPR) repeat protein